MGCLTYLNNYSSDKLQEMDRSPRNLYYIVMDSYYNIEL